MTNRNPSPSQMTYSDAQDAQDMIYLRTDVKIEPLACRWYAWSHLVSPVQHALNVAFRQIPMLRSFISNTSVHEAAAKDPRFISAPFIPLTQHDVSAVRELLETTERICSELTKFAHDFRSLDKNLQENAVGYSLNKFYEELPDSMRGLVELVYDLNNHPSPKVLEELVYRDGLTNKKTQEISFSRTHDSERGFFLNTPRLDTPQRLTLPIHFSDERLDILALARIRAVSFRELMRTLDIDPLREQEFREFFTGTPPKRQAPSYSGDGLRVRYFGHACVLMQTSDVSILVDPVVAWDRFETISDHFTFHDLPDFIDYVFLTHAHQDHFCPEVLIQLRNRVGRILVPSNNPTNVADPSMKLILRNLGFTNVDVLDSLQEINILGGSITALPSIGEHSDLSIISKHGLCVDLRGRKLLLLADADCVDRALYRRLARLIGPMDVLFIGMECDGAPLTWIYGPYLAKPIKKQYDESRRLSGSNCERAWAIVEEFGCKSGVYVYAMGQEPWMKHMMGLQYTPASVQLVESSCFVERSLGASIPAERLFGHREFLFDRALA